MKNYLLICLLLGIFLFFCACSPEEELTPKAEPVDVEARLNRYWDLYDIHRSTNPDSALYYMQELKNLAESADKTKWIVGAYSAIAYVQHREGYLGESAYNHLKAAQLYKDLGNLPKLADVYNNIGDIYSRAKDCETALSYFKLAQDIYFYEGSNDDKILIAQNLATCYRELERYEEAEKELNSAMEAALSAQSSTTISLTYNMLGVLNFEQGNYDKARSYYQLTLQHINSAPDSLRIKAGAFNNIGKTYLGEGDYQQAEEWLNKALVMKGEVSDPLFTLSTLNLLGELRIEQGEYESAVKLLEGGLEGITPTLMDNSVEKGLGLIMEALIKASTEGTIPSSKLTYLNHQFSTYSGKLMVHNNKLSAFREQLETTSKQQALQLANEKHVTDIKLAASEEKSNHIKLVSVFLLLGAAYTIFWFARQRRRTKKMINAIDDMLNKRPNPLIQKVQRKLPEN